MPAWLRRWYKDPLLTVANDRKAVVPVLIASPILFAAAFTVLEQSNPHLIGHAKHGYWVALYWAITTMTTVGYGDVSPATIQGQFLACCLMLWSTFFLLPVVVAHIITSMLPDPNAWTDEEQEQVKQQLNRIERLLKETKAHGIPTGPADRIGVERGPVPIVEVEPRPRPGRASRLVDRLRFLD